MRTRKEYNKLIIKALEDYFDKYQDIRFCQGLYNLDIIKQGEDDYYTEPQTTLKRMSAVIEDISRTKEVIDESAQLIYKALGVKTDMGEKKDGPYKNDPSNN